VARFTALQDLAADRDNSDKHLIALDKSVMGPSHPNGRAPVQ
jgi:hypothetical protein